MEGLKDILKGYCKPARKRNNCLDFCNTLANAY